MPVNPRSKTCVYICICNDEHPPTHQPTHQPPAPIHSFIHPFNPHSFCYPPPPPTHTHTKEKQRNAPAARQVQSHVLPVVQLAVEAPGHALVGGHAPRALRLVEEDGLLQGLVWSGVGLGALECETHTKSAHTRRRGSTKARTSARLYFSPLTGLGAGTAGLAQLMSLVGTAVGAAVGSYSR